MIVGRHDGGILATYKGISLFRTGKDLKGGGFNRITNLHKHERVTWGKREKKNRRDFLNLQINKETINSWFTSSGTKLVKPIFFSMVKETSFYNGRSYEY